MRGQEDGLAESGEALDDLPGIAARARIKPACRLLPEQEPRVACQSHREVETALLATRQLQDSRVLLLRQADQLEDLVARPCFWVLAAKHIHRLSHGQIRIGARSLEHDAQLLLERPLALLRI